MEEVFLEVCCTTFRVQRFPRDFLTEEQMGTKLRINNEEYRIKYCLFGNAFCAKLAWDLMISKIISCRSIFAYTEIEGYTLMVILNDVDDQEVYRRFFRETKGVDFRLWEMNKFIYMSPDIVKMMYEYFGRKEVYRYSSNIFIDIIKQKRDLSIVAKSFYTFMDICEFSVEEMVNRLWDTECMYITEGFGFTFRALFDIVGKIEKMIRDKN